MDYNGYIDGDEERDPNNPWDTDNVRRVKRIFKIALYSISFIVYGVIFFVIFTSCEPGMFDKMFFTEKTRTYAKQNPDSLKVYKLQPIDFMNYDGSIELANIYYAQDTEELEVGIKFNYKKVANGKVENGLVFFIEDSKGNFYTSIGEVYDSNRKYGYARVTFGSVKLDLTSNSYYKYTQVKDYSSFIAANEDKNLKNSTPAADGEDDKGVIYYLYVYSYDYLLSKDFATLDENGNLQIDFAQYKAAYEAEENENTSEKIIEISKHEIYHNNTVISLIDYQYE